MPIEEFPPGDALGRDDVDAVRELVLKHSQLQREDALIRRNSNRGPPMSYDRIIALLHGLGATDRRFALGRATLQSKMGTARMLHA